MTKDQANGFARFVGVVVAVALAATGAVYAYGGLSKDVERNTKDIEGKADKAVIEQIQSVNERDHRRIEMMLQTILQEVRK